MPTLFLKQDELVHGRKGSVFFTISRQRMEMAGIQKITANQRISSTSFATVGAVRKQNRVTGIEGSGSMTINYWMVKYLTSMIDEYKRTNTFPEWDIMIVNENVGATLGTQTVQLFGCQLSGDVPLALLDATTDDGLTIDVNFTFNDSQNLENFSDPQRVGREG